MLPQMWTADRNCCYLELKSFQRGKIENNHDRIRSLVLDRTPRRPNGSFELQFEGRCNGQLNLSTNGFPNRYANVGCALGFRLSGCEWTLDSDVHLLGSAHNGCKPKIGDRI